MPSEPALLAPVPYVHLRSAEETCRQAGKVAFATGVWELFKDLAPQTPVLIYASKSGLAKGEVPEPKEQFQHAYVTWVASFVGYVPSVGGHHPDGAQFRPSSCIERGEDELGDILGFFEVEGLRQLDQGSWIGIEQLGDKSGKAYGKAFIPEGPTPVTFDGILPDADVDVPPSPVSPGSEPGASWAGFAQNLAVALERMEAEQFLVINVSEPREANGDIPNYYVQFACGGEEGFRAEAVSNRFLPDRWRLSEQAAETLFHLGWKAPDEQPKDGLGKVNFYRDWDSPVPHAEVAQMAISTLRRVYGVSAPSELAYRYFDKKDHELELDELGLRRRLVDRTKSDPAVAHLRPLVEGALRQALKASEIKYDAQGDIPIRFGSSLVFVRLLGGEAPRVRVFSPLLRSVVESEELLRALNQINAGIDYGRVFWTENLVVAAMDLPAPGLSPEYVAMACFQIGALADHFDETLAERFGGKTANEPLDAPTQPSKPGTQPGYL